jgi:peptidylprolyl isomerase
MLRLAAAFALAAAMLTGASLAARAETMVLELKDGPVTIELRPDLAPKHVERLKTLANEGFYDGVVFHRVIDGFMAQTGDPTGTGMGGSKLPDLPAEFTTKAQFKRGTIGMARSADPNSANSQFFIVFADAPWLDGQYTIVGDVTSGMDAVDKIKRGEPPTNPDKIISAKVQ